MEQQLEKEILEMIIERLDLEDVDLENFDYDMQIFATEDEEGLGLDSVDALEIVVGLKKDFDVVVDEDEMEAFRSINTLADYVRQKQAEDNSCKNETDEELEQQ